MKKWSVVVLVLLLMAITAASHYLGFFARPFSSLSGQHIQRIELTDMQAKPHSFDELQGNDTVIYFFASWCIPCYKTMATIQQLSEQNQFKVNIVAVALDEDIEGIAGMLDKTAFKGTVWLAKDGTAALQQRYFGNENRAVPYIVRLDKQTQILERAYSLTTVAQWRAVLVDAVTLAEAGRIVEASQSDQG